jgi:hypothetical protein
MCNPTDRYNHLSLDITFPLPHFTFLFTTTIITWWAVIARLARLATSWTVRRPNPVEGESSRTRPDRSWGPPSLLYNRYRVCNRGVKRLGCGFNHPPQSSAEVKERVELHPLLPIWAFMACSRAYYHNMVYVLSKVTNTTSITGC